MDTKFSIYAQKPCHPSESWDPHGEAMMRSIIFGFCYAKLDPSFRWDDKLRFSAVQRFAKLRAETEKLFFINFQQVTLKFRVHLSGINRGK